MNKRGGFTRRTKAERQKEIAEATLKLVATYGVDGTTVSRIAAAVGLSRAALYKHFPNRDAVLLAAMDLMVERSPSWISQTFGDDVFSHLIDMGDKHASWAASEFDAFIHPMFQFAAASGEGKVVGGLGERQSMFVRALADLVEEGKREGSIRKDVDSRDLGWALLMFAWAEDVARLMGADELINSGASKRVFGRMLGDIRASASDASEGDS